MRVFREPETDYTREGLTFALGAVGGLAVGLLLSRRSPGQAASSLGHDLRERAREAGERARSAVRRIEPGRLRRMAREQGEFAELEDAVLDSFFADSILSERGVDVGAISHGIIELSGSVWSEEEADRAVRLANAVPGVRTVVNRLEIENESRPRLTSRRDVNGNADGNVTSIQREVSRTGGMGTRRQSPLTDPDRNDDSQRMEQRALYRADRDQWVDEGFAARSPQSTSHSDGAAESPAGFSDDELDNQDPRGRNSRLTLESRPAESKPDDN
jgi:hypothetical protein